jgi:predicted 2-oxoglutarate/Fe(II)-dependent dioxygenase YbiX/peroxiredoxin
LARFNHLTSYKISDDPEVIKEFELYGLGKVRTLEDYRDYCGVDFKNKTVSETGLRCLFIKHRKKYLSRIYIPELDNNEAKTLEPETQPEQSLAPAAPAITQVEQYTEAPAGPVNSRPIRALPLECGAFIPFFSAFDHEGKRREIHNYAGKNAALIFITNNELLYLAKFFAALRRSQQAFARRQMHVICIFRLSVQELREVYEHYDVWAPIWSDPDGLISASFGIEDQQGPQKRAFAFLVSRNLQVLRGYEFGNIENFMGDIVHDADKLAPNLEHHLVAGHAPVLVVPNVLDQGMCQRLIQYWQAEGERFEGKIGADENSNYSQSWKIRTDTHVTNELQTELDEKLAWNLFPELEKVTGLRVTRREEYKIGCYDGARGGFFNQHRDNFEPGLAYRRYAMTLNLNDDFQGGELQFPEYGGGLYKPSAGTAVIFPCSLMHRANKVTAGQRYMLVSFFYGEEEAQQRASYRQAKGYVGSMDDHKIVPRSDDQGAQRGSELSRFNNMPIYSRAEAVAGQAFNIPRPRTFTTTTGGIPPGIMVIENYLDTGLCKYLTDYADSVVGRKLKVLDNSKTSRSQTVTMESKGRITEHVRIDGVLNELMPVFVDVYTQRLAPYYNVRFEWFERPQILRYPPGGLYNKHADSEHWVKEAKSWVRAQDRDYSILLYLNEDFSGGEIAFVDFDFKLKPKRGMLVAFPADHRYQHAALPTISGTRYVIVSWAAALGTARVKDRPPYAATYLNLPGSD